MEKYNLMLEGKIILVKNMNFSNGDKDHAWNSGRPCVILYVDDEFEYVLPITHSIHEKFINKYFYIDNNLILEFYDKRFKETILKRKNKLNSKNAKVISGYINLRHIYKIPIAYRDEIGKIKYDSYKDIINNLNKYHAVNSLEESLEKAVVK